MNPLIERDFSRLMRRPSVWKTRFLMVGFVGFFAFMAARGASYASADVMGQAFHASFAVAATIALTVQALTEAALILPGERATGALPVLLTVPRSPRSLATGLLAARWLQSSFSMLLLFPLACIPLLLGGVSMGLLATATAAAGIAILQGSAIGLIAGGACRDTRSALIRTGSLVVMLWVLLPGLLRVLATVMELPAGPSNEPWASAEATQAMIHLSEGLASLGPFLAVWAGLSPDAAPMIALPGTLSPLWPALLGALLATGVAILVTARRLTREEESLLVGRKAPGSTAAAGAGVPQLRWGVPGDRPLVWREGRLRAGSSTFLKLWIPRLAWALYLGAFAFFAWGLPLKEEDLPVPPDYYIYDVFLAVPIWGSVLFAISASGTFLPEERERNTLDSLRVTPIPASQYLRARMEAALWRSRYHAIGLGLLWMASVVTGRSHFLALPLAVLGFLPLIPATLAAVMWIGMRAETARVAARRIGFLAFATIVLHPLVVAILAGLTGAEDLAYAIMCSPPYAAFGPLLLLTSGGDFAAVATAAAFLWIIPGILLWKWTLRATREEYLLA